MYLTTAIAYTNGVPHIGHAYEYIVSDTLARFHRLDGNDVFFLTGSDDHGLKIQRSAQKAGKDPRTFVDENAQTFIDLHKLLNISYDRFIRTTDSDHHIAAQELWNRMFTNGDIYQSAYSGWYNAKDEAYVDINDTEELPDGTRIDKISGAPVEWVAETSYFFALSKYQDRLLHHYRENPDFIYPITRRNEIMKFVERGLKDFSISRSTFNWGIPVPHDPNHVMYVWVDALANYITGAGFPSDKQRFDRYWPADIHIIGKDVSRFHAIYWPAFLWSAGLEAPKKIFVHGFVLYHGEKMSKSLGNVITPKSLIDIFGLDQIRYFFLREIPSGSDGSYSQETLLHRINSDLANDFGNLTQRCLSMINKNFDGIIPTPGPLLPEDQQLLNSAHQLYEKIKENFQIQAIHLALEEIWSVLGETNKYFTKQAPWTLKKTTADKNRMGTILYTTAEVVRIAAILSQPAMPESCADILDLLAVPEDQRNFAFLPIILESGTQLPTPHGVFPRISLLES